MTTETREAPQPSVPTKRPMVSVVIPVDGPAEGLEDVVREVRGLLNQNGFANEFVLVDDGTPNQGALSRLKETFDEVKVIRFNQGFGESVALTAGFEKAQGEYLLTMPPYKQVEIEDVLKLLDGLERGYDFVAGWRYPRVDPFLNRVQSSVFNFLARRFTRATFHDLNCKLRAMRRRVAEEIQIYGDLSRFLPILAERKGFKIVEVQLRHRAEQGKVGFFGLGAYLRRMLDLTTMFFLLKFTKRPLRFFGLVAFAFMLVGVAICAYLTYEKLAGVQGLSGRPLLILGVLMIVLGMQTISIGLIGEMIIFTHAKTLKEYEVDELLE